MATSLFLRDLEQGQTENRQMQFTNSFQLCWEVLHRKFFMCLHNRKELLFQWENDDNLENRTSYITVDSLMLGKQKNI